MRSVDDRMVTNMLPKTFKAMEKWENLDELPPEEVYRGFYEDYKLLAENQQHGKLGQRLNKEKMVLIRLPKNFLDKLKEKN